MVDLVALATSTTGLAVIAIVFAAIGWGYLNVTRNERSKMWSKVIAVVAVLGLLATMGAFGVLSTTTATAGQAVFQVTASEDTDQSQIVINDDTNTIQIQMAFNDTSDAFTGGTGGGEVNFTIGREDTSSADATAKAEVGTIGLVLDATGNGKTYPIAAKKADGSWKLDWEKGPNANAVVINDFTTVLVEGGGTNYVRINITLNAEAVAQMDQYDVAKITLTVAGETWAVECLKATVAT